MKIDLSMANTDVLEELAYWPLVENDDTKPRTKTCPFCGKKNAANTIESHNDGCLVEAAQHEYERRLLAAERRTIMELDNGGDYLKLRALSDGRIHIKVGHHCVVTVNHIVPIEWLTTILSEAVLDNNGVGEALKAHSKLPEADTNLLCDQIEKFEFPYID